MSLRAVVLFGVTVVLVAVLCIESNAAPHGGQYLSPGDVAGSVAKEAEKDNPLNTAVIKAGATADTLNDASYVKRDDLPSMPGFEEGGFEKEYENGLIRGQYSYLEEDGVPAQIEYEAIPNVKFEVTKYLKGSRVLPIPDINLPQ